jgi:hypothetical protein
MISLDIQSGYRHFRLAPRYFRLAPRMRDMFIFHYAGRCFRCIAIQFGWGRSPMWLTPMMRPLVQPLRSVKLLRVLAYLDDFFLAPSPPGEIATLDMGSHATRRLDLLLEDLDQMRHLTKGEWFGSIRVEHFGAVIDNELETFFVMPRKIEKLLNTAGHILSESRHRRR